MRRPSVLAATIFLSAAATAEPLPFAAPGRAGLAPPASGPVRAGEPFRLGLMASPGTAALPPPGQARAFLRPAPEDKDDDAETCEAAARQLIAAAGRRREVRDLAVPLLVSFHEDGTVAIQDPQLRLGTAALAALFRLAGRAAAAVADPLRGLLAVVETDGRALHLLDLAALRPLAPIPLAFAPGPLALDWGEGLLWVGAAEADAQSLAVIDLERLAVAATLAVGPGPHALALDDSPAQLLVGSADGGLALLGWTDGEGVAVRARLPSLVGGVTALAAAPGPGLWLAATAETLVAIDRSRGSVRWRLAVGAAPGGLVLAERGNLAVLRAPDRDLLAFVDVARGRLLRSAEVKGVAELLPFGESLVLRRAAAASLGLLPASGSALSMRDPTLASLAAGRSPLPAAGRLPLLATSGGSVLVANPEDRRIYAVMPGMVAPHASFPLPGTPSHGLLAVDRSLREVGRGRLETTLGGLEAGSWQLVLARAGGGALCWRFPVDGSERAAQAGGRDVSRLALLDPLPEGRGWRLRVAGFPPLSRLRLSARDSSWHLPLPTETDEAGGLEVVLGLPGPGRYRLSGADGDGAFSVELEAKP